MKLNILLLLTLFLTFACSSDKPSGKTEAEVLFKEAQELLADEQYTLSSQKLNELRNRYPYSFYATPAELMQADILFLQESFVESAAAYMLFRDLHPKHQDLDYVISRIAESYFRQLPDTFDRDLTAGEEANRYFSELMVKYPNSQYNKDAQVKIEKVNEMTRDKEKYIADFYFKTKEYAAAKWRYLDIIRNYSHKDLISHSVLGAMKSARKLDLMEDCMGIASKYQNKVSDNFMEEFNKEKNKCLESI